MDRTYLPILLLLGFVLVNAIGMIALTTPLADVLREVHQISGVSGAIFVGNELFSVEPPEMRDTFASLSDVVPGPAMHATRGDRELVVQVEELDPNGLGIRAVWIDDAASTSGLFGLLLWVPIVGALLLGIREGLAQDRPKQRR